MMENEIMIQSIANPLRVEKSLRKDLLVVKSKRYYLKKAAISYFTKLLDILSTVDWEYYCRVK